MLGTHEAARLLVEPEVLSWKEFVQEGRTHVFTGEGAGPTAISADSHVIYLGRASCRQLGRGTGWVGPGLTVHNPLSTRLTHVVGAPRLQLTVLAHLVGLTTVTVSSDQSLKRSGSFLSPLPVVVFVGFGVHLGAPQ